ncbi:MULTISPECIES: hypothetical protein [unclassified Luteibacter]|uniref:hypothetical protein n=1 Tax=Luteibacter sp. PvP019 TaxID=3156436 RepID=UPI00339B0D4F
MYLPPEFLTHRRIHDQSVFETLSRLQKRMVFDGRIDGFHDFSDEDPERTILKTYVVAPNDGPDWIFDFEVVSNSADAAEQGEREPIAHHAWISMPEGYDEDQAATLASRVASYVAWRFCVPVSMTLCHEWGEASSVEGTSESKRCAEFTADLLFPARQLAFRDGAEGERTAKADFFEKPDKKMSKKVQKAIEILVEEADHAFCMNMHVKAA